MSPDPNDADAATTPAAMPRRLKTRWQHVALVCRACAKRGNGPDKLKPKRVARALRDACDASGRATKVMLTPCLGLCPKGAMVVVVPGAEGVACHAVADRAEVTALCTSLATPAPTLPAWPAR